MSILKSGTPYKRIAYEILLATEATPDCGFSQGKKLTRISNDT
jgi:hypothetical protein